MIRVLRRVPAAGRARLTLAAGTATVLLLAVITLLGAPLYTSDATMGIVSLQLATSPDDADAILASWDAVPRLRVLWVHGLDLLFPFAYAALIVVVAASAAARAQAAVGASELAAGAAVTAAAADLVENLAMTLSILITPTWGSVLVTLVAAIVKWATLLVAVGALLAALRSARNVEEVRA
jgi:hypothetical protein